LEYRDINRQIEQGKLAPVYFFFGEEDYPIGLLINRIIDKTIDPSTRDFNCDILQGEATDGDSVVTLASSFPMMADCRIVVVKSVQRFSAASKNRILDYVKSPLESTLLILTANKADRRQKFYSALIKNSQWYESKPLYENQAVEWVKGKLKQQDVLISHEGAIFFVQQTGTSLWALHNECEKLITSVYGKKSIGMDDVVRVVGLSRKYNPWELTDAVARKDLGSAMQILHHLMDEGQSEVGLIVNLGARMILLSKIRGLLEKGISRRDIPALLHLRPFFARLYLEQVNHFQTTELNQAIKKLMLADHSIKTGRCKPQIALTLAVFQIIRGTYL